jgi:hypothetical protein
LEIQPYPEPCDYPYLYYFGGYYSHYRLIPTLTTILITVVVLEAEGSEVAASEQALHLCRVVR